jgi:hypothetical protein
VNGVVQGGTVTLPAFSSKVIYRIEGSGCSVTPLNSVGVKVMLGGALNWGNGQMRSDLRTQNLLPSVEPYSAMGISLENGGVTANAALFQATGAQAIVDWVVIELRNADAGYTVAGRRAALVKANGDVVAADGTSQVLFTTATIGRHVVVRHRNHLGAMTAAPLTANAQLVDMTALTTTMYGTNAMQSGTSLRALWPGDVNANGEVRYTGSANDRDPILVAIGAVVPSNSIQGYRTEDVNMDGWTLYSGAGNDRDFVLSTIGGSVPTVVRIAQVP